MILLGLSLKKVANSFQNAVLKRAKKFETNFANPDYTNKKKLTIVTLN